jgi:hypothetical protein
MHRRSALLGLFLIGCAAAGPGGPEGPPAAGPAAGAVPVDEAALRDAIGRVLEDFHDAAAESDEARYFGHFTADAVFLGTDATERWGVEAFRKYAHPHFEKGKGWAFRAVRRAVVIDRSRAVAWFDEDLSTANLGPARGSGVLVRASPGGAWKIAQYNLAITVPNERFDAVKRLLAGEAPPPAAEGAR